MTHRRILSIRPYLGSFGAVIRALSVALLINLGLDGHAPSRVFLVAVLISAITYGLWPALFASLISAIAYDYFFLPPIYSLNIASSEGFVDFVMFMLIAFMVSALATRVRRSALAANARALTAEKLSAFTHCLAAALTVEDVVHKAAEQMSLLLHMPVILALVEADGPAIEAVFPADVAPDAASLQTAMEWWALGSRQQADRGPVIGQWRFHALRGTGETIGLVGARPGRGSQQFSAAQEQLLTALSRQSGLAIERCLLRDRLEQSRTHAETERLRSTVLASISHDLRNPLASITASASILDRQWSSLDDASKLLMMRNVRNEAERLDGFIGKLLDMTSIESSVIKPDCQPVPVLDVVDAALRRTDSVVADHRVTVDVPADLPMVHSDAILLQQVLCNLIENAAKYSPPGSPIRIVARQGYEAVSITVLDEGAGVPDADLNRIFDKFYRTRAAEREATGTGLGLAICRGFLQLMHGTIEAANRNDRCGAAFKIVLPTSSHRELQEVEP